MRMQDSDSLNAKAEITGELLFTRKNLDGKLSI